MFKKLLSKKDQLGSSSNVLLNLAFYAKTKFILLRF